MANYTDLKAAVAAVIKANGLNQITGPVLQNALLSIIDNIAGGSTFKGIAVPSTVPGSPDQNVFYLASTPGVYANFGGFEVVDSLTVFENKSGSWSAISTSMKILTEKEKLSTAIKMQSFPFTTNGFVNANNGNVVADGSASVIYSYSDFINVMDVTSITMSAYLHAAAGVAFYNSAGEYISGWSTGIGDNPAKVNTQILVPDRAVTARFTCQTTRISEFFVFFDAKSKLSTKANHGYTGTPPTLKEVADSFDSVFTDPQGNLIYELGVVVDETRYLGSTGSLQPTNGSYGCVYGVPVEPGKTYCIQGVGTFTPAPRIAGRNLAGQNTGLITPIDQGTSHDFWVTVTIPPGVVTLAFMYIFPTSSRIFQVKEALLPSTVTSKKVKPEYLPNTADVQNLLTLYLDPVNGSDDNSGGFGSPIKTIARFKSLAAGSSNTILYISEGVITEALDLSGLLGYVSVIALEGNRVIFSGSNQISGWEAVAGYSGVYRAAFTDTIPTHGNFNMGRGIVFEVGRSSREIMPDERHPAQKGLTHRLPFTGIQQNLIGTLEDLESNGGYYVSGGFIYLKNTDGTNPAENGYSYEYIKRGTFVGSARISKLFLQGISFRYTTQVSFNSVIMERYNCSIMASSGDGFVDDVTKLRVYFDECCFCGNDGANGHYSSRSNWGSINLRNGGNMAEYYYCWMHDNFDDGLSHHEASHMYVLGGLYEYNGDGGIRPSNTCNGEFHDVMARGNGQDTWSGAGVSGSGFDIVNAAAASDQRNGNNIALYNCVSEKNSRGFASITGTGVMILVNCLAKENSIADYFANSGVIIAKNCKYINSDPLKAKVTTGTGVINIDDYTALV